MSLGHENDSTQSIGEFSRKSQAESESAVIPTPSELRQGQSVAVIESKNLGIA